MNIHTFFWTLMFCICNATSIFLLGEKSLIKGSLNNWESFFKIIFHWKFTASMFFAVVARASFIMINNSLLRDDKFANSSTTVTSFISILSLVFIVIANYFFLGELLNMKQVIGAAILLIGLYVMLN